MSARHSHRDEDVTVGGGGGATKEETDFYDAKTRHQSNQSSSTLAWIFYPFRSAFLSLTTPRKIDPKREADAFLANYEKQYGSDHPPFMAMSFHQSVARCQKESKFLVVYIHCREHQNTPFFCRSVLSSERVCRLFVGEKGDVATKDAIVWGGDVFEAEGRSVSYLLNVTTFPFVALISPKSSTSSRRYVVLKTLAGVRSPEKLESDLRAAMEQHKNDVEETRRQNKARDAQRDLRSSQDAAYLSALEADRKKKEEEERRQEMAEKAAEAAELEAALSLSQKLEEETAIARKKKTLLPEPAAGPGTCTFVFRLPNGSRLKRRFAESEKLENVFTYLDVTFAASDESSGVIKNYAFTAYPHRRFSRESTDLSVSLSDAKLTGRVAVFVQNLDA